MKAKEPNISRREAFVRGIRLLIVPAAVALAATPGQVGAARATKADVFYQERPKEGKSCSTCRLFSMSETGKGTCAVVEGEVSPNGWCMAYSLRS